MGMTDKQFNAFLRELIEHLKALREDLNKENVDKIIDRLQRTLED